MTTWSVSGGNKERRGRRKSRFTAGEKERKVTAS